MSLKTIFLFCVAGISVAAAAPNIPAAPTVLGIQGSCFTLNGQPTFLLGVSYYGGLGASSEFIRIDLTDTQRYGFNWIRVWATWAHDGADVSAVDTAGHPRQPFMDRLVALVAECDRRGLVVDVTLTRGKAAATGKGRLPTPAAHATAVASIVDALKQHRNWFMDLANERDVRDDRHVSIEELKTLREQVRRLDPGRLVTASFGGHDPDAKEIRDIVGTVGADFLAVHRPRDPQSPAQTEVQTRAYRAAMEAGGRVVPVLHQEPFRRGYAKWEPRSADFLTDLRGAVAGGAAGWCFHNGSGRVGAEQPPRSFDLRSRRLFEQLDAEEMTLVQSAAPLTAGAVRCR